jgi:hypothetical protein
LSIVAFDDGETEGSLLFFESLVCERALHRLGGLRFILLLWWVNNNVYAI